jgi:hypothetical protein
MALTYVTFTAYWNGKAFVIAVDENVFFIYQYCYEDSNAFPTDTSKYVTFQYFT